MNPIRTLYRWLPPIGLALLLGACPGRTPSELGDAAALVLVGEGPETTRMDPAEILGARVAGDELHLQVRHGGGCAKHDFALLHSGVFLESFPVQTHLTLAHDAHGDPCRALVAAQLRFDLTPLKRAYQRNYGQGGGVMVIHIRAPGAGSAIAATVRYQF